MRLEFLERLHCPFTGTPFSLTQVDVGDASDVDYGVVTSEAGDFPVVEGILRLLVDDYREAIVDLIRRKDRTRALLAALELPFHSRGDAAANLLLGLAFRSGHTAAARGLLHPRRRLYRELMKHPDCFAEMAEGAHRGLWTSWNKYRFSMPTFLSVYPLLHLLQGQGPVLDFACGVGHSSFLISRTFPGQLVCADYSFSSLYMAKQYFVRDAAFVCLDGDFALPFESGYFGYVFSSDALHCIDARRGLSGEFTRVLKRDGTVICPHLHNRLSGVKFGKSLSPAGYAGLFEGFERRVLAEREIVDRYVREGTLDLEREGRADDVDREEGISLVATRDPAILRKYVNLWPAHLARMQNPVLNPVYQLDATRIARRRALASMFVQPLVSDGSEIALPDSAPIPSAINGSDVAALRDAEPLQFQRLVSQFVIVDVPERFMARGPATVP